MNPEITPDRCPMKEACGTNSWMITNSAQGASRRGMEKKPKSSLLLSFDRIWDIKLPLTTI